MPNGSAGAKSSSSDRDIAGASLPRPVEYEQNLRQVVKRVRRGFAVALAISLAAHAALVAAPWSGTGSGARLPAAPPTIVARLLQADRPEATTPEIAPPLAHPETVAPAEALRPDATTAATQPASISELPAQPGPRRTETVALPPVPESASESASATSPSSPAASDDRAATSTTMAEPSSGPDRGPQLLEDIEPVFPVAAGNRGGRVTLRLVVSDQGAVETIEVLASSPPGLFDAAAMAAFGQARFSPGLKGGVAVRSEVRYDVTFAPIGRGSDTSGRTY
jgi:periplasmic protein TonB